MVSPHRACISTTFKACLRSSPFTSSFHIVNPLTPTSCSSSRLFIISQQQSLQSTQCMYLKDNRLHQGPFIAELPLKVKNSIHQMSLQILFEVGVLNWGRRYIRMATIMTMTITMKKKYLMGSLSKSFTWQVKRVWDHAQKLLLIFPNLIDDLLEGFK